MYIERNVFQPLINYIIPNRINIQNNEITKNIESKNNYDTNDESPNFFEMMVFDISYYDDPIMNIYSIYSMKSLIRKIKYSYIFESSYVLVYIEGDDFKILYKIIKNEYDINYHLLRYEGFCGKDYKIHLVKKVVTNIF